jgi:hypothetical protein
LRNTRYAALRAWIICVMRVSLRLKTAPHANIPTNPPTGVTIAIVEGEEITGELLSAWVREMGYVPVSFANGKSLNSSIYC